MDTVLRQDLIDIALRATDAYLGVEKHSMKNGFATNQDIHDFSFYLSKAHDALTQLGDIDNHYGYMIDHVNTMLKLANHDDSTLADLPYVHVPKSDTGEVAEETQLDEISQALKQRYAEKSKQQVRELEPFAKKGSEYRDLTKNLIKRREAGIKKATNEEIDQLDEEASKGLAAKAAKSGISLSTLKKVYSRGVAAWKTGHRPGTTPQQWGMARVNSYITKGKTYHTADKDLHEETKKKDSEKIDTQELEKIANTLSWEDIADTYEKEDYVTEETETVDEGLTPAARLKKQRDFRRTGVKRNILRGMRLQRVSSPDRLKQRSILAARRLLSKRFLAGRDKSALSPQEKDILEQRLKRLQQLGVQTMLAQRLMPKIRRIEQTRLKHKSK